MNPDVIPDAEPAEMPQEDLPACPWWLLGLVLALAVLNLITALGTTGAEQGLTPAYPPALRIILAGGWCAGLSALGWGLWRRKRRAFRLVAPVLTIYAVMWLAWLAAFARSDYDRGRFAFQIGMTVIMLIPVWWTARKWWQEAQTSSA